MFKIVISINPHFVSQDGAIDEEQKSKISDCLTK